VGVARGAWPGGHVTAVDQSKIYVTEPAYLHYLIPIIDVLTDVTITSSIANNNM